MLLHYPPPPPLSPTSAHGTNRIGAEPSLRPPRIIGLCLAQLCTEPLTFFLEDALLLRMKGTNTEKHVEVGEFKVFLYSAAARPAMIYL